MSRNNASFDVFEEEEKVSSPKKKILAPAATVSPDKKSSPIKKILVQKPSPPPPPPAAAVVQASALPKHPDDLISKEARERASDAEKQNRESHDLVCRTNRMLSESVENLAKMKSTEKAELYEAMRDLRVLTEAIQSGNNASQKLAENLMTTVSQQQQAIERLLEARLPVTTTGRVRAPAPEVTAPKGLGLDNESKADKAKRQKKEKEEAAAAAASKKKEGEEKKAGEKRKADASPEREKQQTVTSKLKGDQPTEKKQRSAAPPAKTKPAVQKKKKSSNSDDDSASESEDEERFTTPPRNQKKRSESPAMTQAQPMDD